MVFFAEALSTMLGSVVLAYTPTCIYKGVLHTVNPKTNSVALKCPLTVKGSSEKPLSKETVLVIDGGSLCMLELSREYFDAAGTKPFQSDRGIAGNSKPINQDLVRAGPLLNSSNRSLLWDESPGDPKYDQFESNEKFGIHLEFNENDYTISLDRSGGTPRSSATTPVSARTMEAIQRVEKEEDMWVENEGLDSEEAAAKATELLKSCLRITSSPTSSSGSLSVAAAAAATTTTTTDVKGEPAPAEASPSNTLNPGARDYLPRSGSSRLAAQSTPIQLSIPEPIAYEVAGMPIPMIDLDMPLPMGMPLSMRMPPYGVNPDGYPAVPMPLGMPVPLGMVLPPPSSLPPTATSDASQITPLSLNPGAREYKPKVANSQNLSVSANEYKPKKP